MSRFFMVQCVHIMIIGEVRDVNP